MSKIEVYQVTTDFHLQLDEHEWFTLLHYLHPHNDCLSVYSRGMQVGVVKMSRMRDRTLQFTVTIGKDLVASGIHIPIRYVESPTPHFELIIEKE